ncbi:MAG: hypothetical protein WDZ48_06030, partial [Pirellulales bacterium]
MTHVQMPTLQTRRASEGLPFLRTIAMALLGVIVLTGVVRAEILPPPPIGVTLPAAAKNAFGVSVTYSPSDGLMYVWNGAQVLKQDAPLSASFTSIGNVGSGSADPGAIAFSRDSSSLILGNGAGGLEGGSNAGLIFTIPASGGDSDTPIATVPFHDTFLAAPLSASNNKVFIDQGNASFTGSNVSVLDDTSGINVTVIQNIPGASTSLAINAGRLFVGVGFGPMRGQLHSFLVSDLQTAYDASMPLDWDDGQVFNDEDNNSGFGLFFDARGFLFAGGPSGVTVFDAAGNNRLYDNSGFTGVVYDPVNDRVLVTGFGDHQGLYPASMFVVPEPSTVVMALGFAVFLAPRWRRVVAPIRPPTDARWLGT